MQAELQIMRLRDALRMLPSVKPVSAMKLIAEWIEPGLTPCCEPGHDPDGEPLAVNVGGRLILLAAPEEVKQEEYCSAYKTSPEGAQLLLSLYTDRVLPMPRTHIITVPEDPRRLDSYSCGSSSDLSLPPQCPSAPIPALLSSPLET